MPSETTGANNAHYESVVRQMITDENTLTNQRMLWMAAFNGLLFAALGFAWDKPRAHFLAIVFSVLGVTASALNGIVLISAAHAQRRLLLWWHEKGPHDYDGPGVMGHEPMDKKMYSHYLAPWVQLAFAFAAGWLAILIYVLRWPW
jgi:hypothetical protein